MDKENFQRQWERFKPAVMRNRAVLISCLVVGLGLIGLAVTYSGGATDHPVTSHCETPQGPSPRNTDSCPWQLVLSDLSHRLRLLEMAFKEQVIAREVIAAEVSNQTDSSQELEKKLQEFSAAMSLVSHRLDKLHDQLSQRLYSDECLGFLVLMVLVIQLFLTLRAKVMERLHHYSLARDPATHNGAAVKKLSNSGIPKSSSNTSINGAAPSPKSVSYSKQDVCVTTFSRNNAKIVTSQAELLLRNIDDSKTFVKPQSCVIESLDILCECPKSKLYLLFVDAASCGTRPDDVTTAAATTTTAATATINSEPKTTTADQPDLTSQPAILSQTELLLLTVRHVKSMGGNVILIIINDQGSQRLPVSGLYNACLALVRSNDVMQALTSGGRLMSIWKEMSLHQINHARKLIKSTLFVKSK